MLKIGYFYRTNSRKRNFVNFETFFDFQTNSRKPIAIPSSMRNFKMSVAKVAKIAELNTDEHHVTGYNNYLTVLILLSIFFKKIFCVYGFRYFISFDGWFFC